MPDWYPFLKVARWLGVPPWELQKQSQVWQVWAGMAMRVDKELGIDDVQVKM